MTLNHPETAFRVRIHSSGLEIDVPPDFTLLECLRLEGLSVESSCEQGLCGTCELGVLAGRVDHRDTVLTQEQRDSHRRLMPCVSRAAEGDLLVLDL